MKAKNVYLQSRDIGKTRDRISKNFYKEIAIVHPEHDAVARFRFYSVGESIHCIAWLSGKEAYGSGHGKAGGYGYCKESAAMERAIYDSGVTLSESIAGVGESAMRKAANAIGTMLTGKRKFYTHIAHS